MIPRPSSLAAALALCLLPAAFQPASSAPHQFLPVGDPLEAELRVLELYEPASSRVRLPHLNARPLQWHELRGDGAGSPLPSGARGIALRRIERARRWNDPAPGDAIPGATPRLFQREWPGDTRLELSTGLEGEREWTRADGSRAGRWEDGSGIHLRGGAQLDRWFAFAHVYMGQLAGVREYSDALVDGTDFAVGTEESYVAYTVERAWSVQLGRSRWHWGPGEESSLLLSKTAAPLSGLMMHARIEPLRADLFLFDATVHPGRGEQLAAHRLEWQVRDWARVAISEAARYRSSGWQGLYVAGVIPYSLVQRLLDQDSRDTPGETRNNVLLSLDASVRIADGSRLYGELLLDDVHARSAAFPNKYGWQAGWDGAGSMSDRRVTWNAEYTWLSRYVYSSFYGRAFTAQDRPLGHPEGPGSRRLRLRVSADPTMDWQLSVFGARSERGEETVADAFVPGDPVPDVGSLAGVPERERTVEGEVRWWPASGVDVALRGGREWRENAAHLAGASASQWRGSLALRLTR